MLAYTSILENEEADNIIKKTTKDNKKFKEKEITFITAYKKQFRAYFKRR